MSLKVLEKFEVKRLEILNEAGEVDAKLIAKFSQQQIKQMYEWMLMTRAFDEKAINLQRQGRLLTYAPMLGQEATIIGSALAYQQEDWVVPCFRESGVFLMRGYPMEMLFQYWGGDERGMKIPENINMLPVAIPVGTQTLHAVGIAYALKYQKKKSAVAVYFGDGATSEGDFHEAMNFASALQLPIVFICQNNQWAISVPLKQQTAAKTLAQKAIAYGFEKYIQVDGNDVFAVHQAATEALDAARKGKGPAFIECLTYRMSNHTTADDYKKYRSEKDVESWKRKDPIARLKKYMQAKKIWTEAYEKEIITKITQQVEDAVKKYESLPQASPEDIFKFMYQNMPAELREQMKNLKGGEE